MDSCVLFWDNIHDSLHRVDFAEKVNTNKQWLNDNLRKAIFYSDNNYETKLGRSKTLNLKIFIPKDSLGFKTYIMKQYVLKKYKTCRIGLH